MTPDLELLGGFIYEERKKYLNYIADQGLVSDAARVKEFADTLEDFHVALRAINRASDWIGHLEAENMEHERLIDRLLTIIGGKRDE